MTPSQQLSAAAVLTAVVAVSVIYSTDTLVTQASLDAGVAVDTRSAFLARGLDGGLAYLAPQRDGAVVLLTAAPYVRRRAGSDAGSCLRSLDGKAVDFGELNRFPAAEASGPDCEAVAATVGAEDPNASEAADLALVPVIQTAAVAVLSDAGAVQIGGAVADGP